jgi:formyl-CoA transferase
VSTLPLSDVRVIEMGQLLAGPFCAQLLGDFGAEVIKVEAPGEGDAMRGWGRIKRQGLSLHWPIIGRNKKSITLNLRSAQGQEIARKLLAQADVLVENFRPGTLERWGLSPEELWKVNRGLVVTRVTGYGQTGPYAPRAGFGVVGEAMGGLRYVTGDPATPPARVSVSIGDELAGTFAALGTLVALHHRQNTGRGQVVDASLYESVFAMMEAIVPEWEIGGYQRERTGSILPGAAPSNVYPALDGSVLIGGNRDTIFQRLTEVMGQPELAADPRFATHDARGANSGELDRIISAWSSPQESGHLLATLHEAGVPAGLIYRAKDMLEDPHFEARESIVRLKHEVLGDFPMQGVFPKLSETPGAVRALGPELGEHNADVYRDLLGLSDDEVAALRSDAII